LLQKHKKLPTPGGKKKKKNWNTPKIHMHTHMIRDIQGKGVTRNYTTKTFEVMHKPLKEFYLFMTNFKNVAPQVGFNTVHRSTLLD
jgi:hypothetical protein